jgi:hypothetical protein
MSPLLDQDHQLFLSLLYFTLLYFLPEMWEMTDTTGGRTRGRSTWDQLIDQFSLKRKRLVQGFRALATWNLHIQGYPSCIWFCCPRIPAQIVSSFATGNLICTRQLDTILFHALALVSRDILCGRRNSAQIFASWSIPYGVFCRLRSFMLLHHHLFGFEMVLACYFARVTFWEKSNFFWEPSILQRLCSTLQICKQDKKEENLEESLCKKEHCKLLEQEQQTICLFLALIFSHATFCASCTTGFNSHNITCLAGRREFKYRKTSKIEEGTLTSQELLWQFHQFHQ